MRFSEKLILLRKRKGMTQEEFSRAVGVSRQSVYKWESGQSYPEAVKLLEIRRLYGVSIDHLLDDSVSFPFPTNEQTTPFVKETKEIFVPTPSYVEQPSESETLPKEEPQTVTVTPAPHVEEPKKPETVQPSPRPATASVLVQRKKKKPSTLREIVGAFFGKKK